MGNTDRYAGETAVSRTRRAFTAAAGSPVRARNVRGSSAPRTGTMFNKSFSDLLEIREASASSAVGLAEAQGWRPTMEDAFVMNLDAIPGCSVVAVFDGHGGSTVSAYGARELAPRLAAALGDCGGDGERALARVFLDLDAALRDEHGAALDQMGSTVVCVLVAPDSLTCGWLGDSRAVLCAGGAAAPLSFDHKPQGDGERARIAAAEGHVFRGRVNGMLAVSRALGDFLYKARSDLGPEAQLVSCEAGAGRRARDAASDEFLVVACDGIWEKLTNDQACALVRAAWHAGSKTPEAAARKLVEWSLLCGSTDNMTCCVVVLDAAKLDAVSEADARRGLEAAGLSYPAALHARDVLGLRRAGVGAMDEKAVLGLVEACGLGRHAKAFAENRVDGECLLEVAEAEFVEDLHMAPADARFLALALGWWEKTTSWA